LNAPEIQVRVNVSLRVRAGTPAHPGSHADGDARAPRRRSVCRLRKQAGTPAHPGSQAGGDAHPLRRRSVCRLRMRAGTPAHPGGAQSAVSVWRRGRPRTQARMRAGTPAHPGRIWFNHSAHRSKCSISMSPRARGVYRIKFSIFISPTASSPIGYRLSAIPLPSSKLSYRLSAIGYSSAPRPQRSAYSIMLPFAIEQVSDGGNSGNLRSGAGKTPARPGRA
jgi:hypothetical protein